MIDAINAQGQGGEPEEIREELGRLAVPSGVLVLGDPRYVPSFESAELGGIVAQEVTISARLRRYPSSSATVMALDLDFDDGGGIGDARRKVGEVGIDSAKLVIADKADLEGHWADVGRERIGVIGTARDLKALKLLTRRFRLETRRVNRFRAEVVGPVSVALEAEIEAYLKSIPKYANYPFFHFRVETRASFERVNELATAWGFLPVGNDPEPLMFACETGRGDGRYEVWGRFRGEVPRGLSIDFFAGDYEEE